MRNKGKGTGKHPGSTGEAGKGKGQRGKEDRRTPSEKEPLLGTKRSGVVNTEKDAENSETLTGAQKIKKRKLDIEHKLETVRADQIKLTQQAQGLRRELHVANHQSKTYSGDSWGKDWEGSFWG